MRTQLSRSVAVRKSHEHASTGSDHAEHPTAVLAADARRALPGALAFSPGCASDFQVLILSDTFYPFA